MAPAVSPLPWRTLAVLALGVLVAHALLLVNSPAWWGMNSSARHAPAVPPPATFSTRQLAPAQPALAIAATPAAVLPKPPSAPKPRVLKPKALPAQVEPAAHATDLIANQSADSAVPETPIAADVPSPAASAAVTAGTAGAARSAASAPGSTATLPTPTAVTAVVLPSSAVLTYDMTGNAKGLTYHASAELGWRNLGAQYDARMTVSALFLGARSMASVGQLGAGGLAPTRFSDKSRTEVAAHFEPDKGLITFSANTPPAPWVPGAQDRVSVFFQLSGMIAADPARFPVGTMVSVYTAGPRAADTWVFRVDAEEVLTLPYGNIKTVKLARQPQKEYDQAVEIWLSPVLDYLPVRNKITQSNGDFIDQQLSGLTRP